ncbi:MAG: hypothetical protein LBQ66_00705 [Planctomycetaceae bacterium]|nr:hypothetical protein [Planctomycetaceae bacterium]
MLICQIGISDYCRELLSIDNRLLCRFAVEWFVKICEDFFFTARGNCYHRYNHSTRQFERLEIEHDCLAILL